MAVNQQEAGHGAVQRVFDDYQEILPNMLTSVTYSLNKFNSKRAIDGLEYQEGFYKPVVKLGSIRCLYR